MSTVAVILMKDSGKGYLKEVTSILRVFTTRNIVFTVGIPSFSVLGLAYISFYILNALCFLLISWQWLSVPSTPYIERAVVCRVVSCRWGQIIHSSAEPFPEMKLKQGSSSQQEQELNQGNPAHAKERLSPCTAGYGKSIHSACGYGKNPSSWSTICKLNFFLHFAS